MKQKLIFIPFFLLAINPGNADSFKKQYQRNAGNFYLQFVTIGFGSNMFEMQPIFTVNETKFVYTSEEVWVLPGQTNIMKDTLLIGSFRASSIDSILKLTRELKDTAIYRANIHYLSGSLSDITIKDGVKKIIFDLHNASDTTADKIVAILNSYIPGELGKLHICCGTGKGRYTADKTRHSY